MEPRLYYRVVYEIDYDDGCIFSYSDEYDSLEAAKEAAERLLYNERIVEETVEIKLIVR